MDSRNHETSIPAVAAMVALVSVQTGAAIGNLLFSTVGPEEVAVLRLGLSALLLTVALRPWKIWRRASWPDLLLYGAMMALMNLLIYRAFLHAPVGIAVSIEVIGPLGAAALTSKRRADLIWVGLSLVGLVLLPLGSVGGNLDWRGVAYSLAAAICWGLYVIAGKRVSVHGGQAVATGMLIAAAVAVPLGAFHAGVNLLTPAVIGIGFVVALLSSTFPLLLDMFAMRRLPTHVFGILLSASPAVSALAGWLVLNEVLSPLQWGGIVVIMAACIGSALGSKTATVGKAVPEVSTQAGVASRF